MTGTQLLERTYSPSPELQQYTIGQLPSKLTDVRELKIEASSPFRVEINGRETIRARSLYTSHRGPLTVEKSPRRLLRGSSIKVYGTENNPQLEVFADPSVAGQAKVFYDPELTIVDGKEFRNLDYLKISGLSRDAEIVATV